MSHNWVRPEVRSRLYPLPIAVVLFPLMVMSRDVRNISVCDVPFIDISNDSTVGLPASLLQEFLCTRIWEESMYGCGTHVFGSQVYFFLKFLVTWFLPLDCLGFLLKATCLNSLSFTENFPVFQYSPYG
jgi:hypothetical protein